MPEVNKPKLAQKIYQAFKKTELNTDLCFPLNIVWDDVERNSRRETIIEIINHAERHGKLPKLLEQCSKKRPNEDWLESTSTTIPFTNRQQELKRLAYADTNTKYLIVHAPMGYGKTTLLTEVRKHYLQKDWLCILTKIHKDENPNLDNIFASKLEISLAPTRSENPNPGERFGSAFVKACIDKPNKKGLALLIDLEGEPSKVLLATLLTKFIPKLEAKLSKFNRYNHNDFGLRVIIAGRYLFHETENIEHELPLTDIALSPFKFEHIRDSAMEFFRGMFNGRYESIAGIALCLGAGHPGCMAEIFNQILETLKNPDEYLQDENCWEDIVKKYAESVYKKMLQDFGKERASYLICIFRYLDVEALAAIKTIDPILDSSNMEIDEFEIADLLTKTYLFSSSKGLIKDSIIRRLMVLHAYYSLGEGEFAKLCKQAQEICLKNIHESIIPPPYWISEYLYQCLLENIGQAIKNNSARKILRTKIFKKHIPIVVDKLFTEYQAIISLTSSTEDQKLKNRKQKILYNNLIEYLNDSEQWELRFMLNYYLRDNDIDQMFDAPFQQFLREIKQVANKIIGEGID